MYNREEISTLISFITERNGIEDKHSLILQVQRQFGLTKDRSVFYCDCFAIRFCSASSMNFSNTVLSLSSLQKFDRIPFIICIVTRKENHLLLANSTFLKKISHSSQDLRCDNIRGSFNGSDIIREYGGIPNIPENFETLFNSHENFSFNENLERLVESTNGICPTRKRFIPTDEQSEQIIQSIDRSISFMNSAEYTILNKDLDAKVKAVESEITIAAFIDNVNLRGRIIEYLITAENDLKDTLLKSLHDNQPLPKIFTSDDLGDYKRNFSNYHTLTDIKTKILFLSGNPKGYNIDKLLSFLSDDKSVFLIFIVAIDEKRQIRTRLCSIFSKQLISGTRIMKQWAGRNSRGVTQFDGRVLEKLIESQEDCIDYADARNFLCTCLEL